MNLFAIGLSHKTAPVALREQFAVKQSEIVRLARTLKVCGLLDEIVLLSTCNRVEIYGVTQNTTSNLKPLFQLLCSEPQELNECIYVHEGAAAIRHLLQVAAGLDSMVLGETEIIGQIKHAYEISHSAKLTGRILNRLFQRAFQTTKEIRTRTDIGRGAVSIKSAAVELIGKTFGGDFSQPIMVIGAGDVAKSCVRSLSKKGARSILISNRSFDRALDLALQCGAEAVCFGDCLFGMRDVDVVIAATSSSDTLLNRDDAENLMKARRRRPLLLIDLAVPRNIDPAVRKLENISLYDIDDLETIAREGVAARQQELAACYQIIEAHVAALVEKLHAENAAAPSDLVAASVFKRAGSSSASKLGREKYL